MPRPTNAPQPVRLALAPAILAVIVLLAGLALIGTPSWYVWIDYAVAILVIIVGFYVVKAKAWWWLIGIVPIVVIWNPVLPISIDDLALRVLHILASAFLVAVGLTVRVIAD